MKHKRLIALLVIALGLTGCGKKSSDDSSNTPTDATEITSETTTENSSETTEATTEESLNIIPEEYAYALTVTINPEVKLYFDGSDSIVGVEYMNADAEDAYSELNLVGSTFDEGFNMLIDAAIEKEYLKVDGPVSIELSEVKDTTVIKDTSKLQEAKAVVNECIVAKEDFEWQSAVETDVAETVTQDTGIEPVVVCDACNGTGNDCAECNGTGIVNCKRCVNGFETCGTCHGSGTQTCNGCHGAGIDDHGETCSYCGGSGVYTCEQCGGAGGFADCSWCHGALKHVCPICEGQGVCSKCGGTGVIQ